MAGRRGKKKRELDIACIVDGKIIAGEATTEPLRSRDITKSDLMHRNYYKPPAVVFATSLATVNDDFRSRADALEGLVLGELAEKRNLLSATPALGSVFSGMSRQLHRRLAR
jgi:hypothetical protein